MLETRTDRTGDDYVQFPAGAHAKGQYRCSDCGYGITIHDELPACPMCAGTSWELVAWTPFANARELQRLHREVLS